MRRLLLLSLFSVVWLSATLALAHPYESYTVNEPPACYDREGINIPSGVALEEWNYNDITYVRSYPDPTTLSDAEKYMLFGAYDAPPMSVLEGPGNFSWISWTLETVRRYYSKYGEIPVQVTPEVYAKARGRELSDVPDTVWEFLKSPITGDYPYLNTYDFSPGDLLITILTEDEKLHFAGLRPFLHELWYNDRVRNSDDTSWDELVVSTPIYYIRAYGWNGVIDNHLTYGGTIQTN